MSTNDSDPPIRVAPTRIEYAFATDFAERYLRRGQFRARGGQLQTWQLDCREGLGESRNVCRMAGALHALATSQFAGVHQFVGAGFGAFILLGGILGTVGATKPDTICRGALVRPAAKRYGMAKRLEGSITAAEPVCIIDDILNSGTTALQVVELLRREGFTTIHLVAIYDFKWGGGDQRLAEHDVRSACLAEVSRCEEPSPRRRRGWWPMTR